MESADGQRLKLKALMDAARRRHRLAPESPEYASALATEERLAAEIWDSGIRADHGRRAGVTIGQRPR
jgi:hypothetical protein